MILNIKISCFDQIDLIFDMKQQSEHPVELDWRWFESLLCKFYYVIKYIWTIWIVEILEFNSNGVLDVETIAKLRLDIIWNETNKHFFWQKSVYLQLQANQNDNVYCDRNTNSSNQWKTMDNSLFKQ